MESMENASYFESFQKKKQGKKRASVVSLAFPFRHLSQAHSHCSQLECIGLGIVLFES